MLRRDNFLFILILIVLGLIVIAVSPVAAQDTPPVTTLEQKSGAEGWLWAMRYWAPPGEPRDLAGGRVQMLLGVGKWGFAVRGDASGMPGEFSTEKFQTFRTLEAHLGIHYNVAASQGVQVGAAVGTGLAVSLEQGEDGLPPKTPNNFSYGAGLRIAGNGWWAYLMGGQYQALPGFSAIGTYQIKMSDRTAMVGTFAYGAQQRYVAQLGIAVRWW